MIERLRAFFKNPELTEEEAVEIYEDASVIKELDRDSHRWFISLTVIRKLTHWDNIMYVEWWDFEWTWDNWYESVPEMDFSDLSEVVPMKEMIEVTNYVRV